MNDTIENLKVRLAELESYKKEISVEERAIKKAIKSINNLQPYIDNEENS